MKFRRYLGPLFFLLMCAAVLVAAADRKPQTASQATATQGAAAPMDRSKRALHALNRLTFGPRPGEMERVEALGVERWIEQQLNPGKIDDAALQARLQPYRTLAMDSNELLKNFPPPFVLKAVAEGRVSMPSDPKQRAIYESQMAAYRNRQQGKATNDAGKNGEMDEDARAERREARMYAELKAEEIMGLLPEKRAAEIMKLSAQERAMLTRGMAPQDRQRMLEGMTPEQRETVLAMANPRIVVTGEMQSAKILRAAYSERQLEEVMTDFWFNHFNVYDKKGPDAYLIGEYERDVLRPRALGKFEDLLRATAKSPAMLFYLDNWQSVGPNSEFAKNGGRRQRGFRRGRSTQQPRMDNDPQNQQLQQARQRRSGLNENYAREVMELHTLGVDGGYTQQDVTELAKVLTGWTIRQPRLGGDFEYNSRFHEPGTKTVVGQTFSGGGEREGEDALRMLARHPATAKFISRKLAMRFVADEPSPALVERMAQTFLKSEGDIKEVLRTLFRSPEFWSQQSYRAKVKTPFEFVVSSLRATNAEVQNPFVVAQALNKMGMPLYGMQPPTGYSMKADAWVNSAALLNRMNFALGLGTGRLPGVTVDSAQILEGTRAGDAGQTLAALESKLLAGDVSQQTHATLEKQLTDPKLTGASATRGGTSANAGVIAGLILGSPEFQRR